MQKTSYIDNYNYNKRPLQLEKNPLINRDLKRRKTEEEEEIYPSSDESNGPLLKSSAILLYLDL